MSFFRITLLPLILSAAPVLACGNGECEPPAPPSPPPVVEPLTTRSSDRDPTIAPSVIHYGYCCQVGGKMRVGTAWLRDPVTAYEQCRARQDRMQSLPECPARLGGRKGGE